MSKRNSRKEKKLSTPAAAHKEVPQQPTEAVDTAAPAPGGDFLGRYGLVVAVAVILAAGVAAYWNSFGGGFVYDDKVEIQGNPHLGRLWPLSEAVSLPLWSKGGPFSRRPLVALSFSLNRAVLGPGPWGYHLVNLAIHVCAALVLLGIVRRTLRLPRFGGAWAPDSLWLALAVAVIWLVHPLQTAGVTYIVQRSESLMGLFFLLTLYCALRAFEGPRRRGLWYAGAIAACALGTGAKEVMVVAPLVVLLYDVVFVGPSFARTLRSRWWFYLALAATWGIPVVMILMTKEDAARGFFAASSRTYAMTQPGVILYYLWLSVWPSPLLADYAWPDATGALAVAPAAAAILGLLVLTAWGLWRRNWLGFLGAWFFLILAPSSSFVALLQNVQDQRMYLPLAAVVIPAVVGGWRILLRLCRPRAGKAVAAALGGGLAVAVAAVFGTVTVERNSDYRDVIGFWQKNVSRRPASYRAYTNLGIRLVEANRFDEGIAAMKEAMRLTGESPVVRHNLGLALFKAGRTEEAIQQHERAIVLYEEGLQRPEQKAQSSLELPETLCDLAEALAKRGRPRDLDQALRHCERAILLRGDYANAWTGLGMLRARLEQYDKAIEAFTRALDLTRRSAESHYNLAVALQKKGLTQEAIGHFKQSLALGGDQPQVHANLGVALASVGQYEEAIQHYERALALRSVYPEAHYRLGRALAELRRFDEAIPHYAKALDQGARLPEVHFNLGKALASTRRLDAALVQFSEALRLKPNYPDPHEHMAAILAYLGKLNEAVGHYEAVLALQPDAIGAMNNLAWLLATRPSLAGREQRAVELAERAVALTRRQDPEMLDTLGAALAAAGRFPEAAATANEAIGLAQKRGDQEGAKIIQGRLALYRDHQPFRQPERPGGPSTRPTPPARQ